MSIAAFIPLRNQEVRIQPLMREIKKRFFEQIEYFIFINENSTDQTEHVLNQELALLGKDHKYIKMLHTNRRDSFIEAWNIAKKNENTYLISFHEGWEDNIEEIQQIILTQTFENFCITSSVRTPHNENLGHLLNTLSCSLVSKKLSCFIPETKGDSIDIYKLDQLSQSVIKDCHEQIFHLALLCHSKINNHHIQFTAVDNGLNFKSYIKLNTKRFLLILKYLRSIKPSYQEKS